MSENLDPIILNFIYAIFGGLLTIFVCGLLARSSAVS